MNDGALNDTALDDRWSAATITLHWLSALVIVGLLVLGLAMVHAIDDAA